MSRVVARQWCLAQPGEVAICPDGVARALLALRGSTAVLAHPGPARGWLILDVDPYAMAPWVLLERYEIVALLWREFGDIRMIL